MYRILIVDDEKVERSGICFLLRKMDQPIEILEASNGKIALEILEKEKVDILLTDIKMPFMDGMELIENIDAKNQNIKIIIFSGYGDFEYARKGMKYGVQDYILKPAEPTEFKNTILKVIRKLQEERAERDLKSKSQSYLLEHILYSIVNGSDVEETEKIGEDMVDLEIIHCFRQMILIEFESDFFGKKDNGIFEIIENKLGQDIHYLNLNPQQGLFFLFEYRKLEEREIYFELMRSLTNRYTVTCHLAISEELHSAKDIAKQAELLDRVMENKFYQVEKKVYFVEEIKGEYVIELDDDVLFKKLKQDIKMKDINGLKNHFEWVCEKYSKKTEYSHVYVKFIFSSLLKDFHDALPEHIRGAIDKEVERLYRSTDFISVKAIIEENIKRLEESFQVNPQMLHREIEAVKQYIYDHYQEEISIDILAKQVYLAPSYLSAIFKKGTKQNLSKFIKEYRMNKAKEMLENTHMKIVQVSEAVGYPNVSYFCQSFREYFGVSPQKFRSYGVENETDLEMGQ